MKRNNPLFLALVLLGFFACQTPFQPPAQNTLVLEAETYDDNGRRKPFERVVIANRGSSDLTVINAVNNKLMGTIMMPNNGEPMYVVHLRKTGKVYVGDRANDLVAVFNQKTMAYEGSIPAGNGVFHMWASRNGSQLWVNNDVDNTTTVIDPVNMSVLGTAVTPADLVAQGGKPHDVFISPNGQFAFVSVLGVSGTNDYIVKYSTSTFMELDRVAVGKDPHLFMDNNSPSLYVACQNTNEVIVINPFNLNIQTSIPFPAAHGIFMSPDGQYVYVSNITGSEVGVISTATNTLLGTNVGTPHPVPHNLAVNSKGKKLFVTHSGATADRVTIYRTNQVNPSFIKSLTAGTNPFGLAYYRF